MRKVILTVILLAFPLICFAQDALDEGGRLSLVEAEGLVRNKIFDDSPGMNNPKFKLSFRELTTEKIWKRLKAQVFKAKEYSFGGSPLGRNPAYLIKDKKILLLGDSWGGSGLMSMCVVDLDKDNQSELLYTYSWGSGMHRTHLALYFEKEGKPETIEWDSVYPHGDLFLKKIDDQNVIVEIGELKDYKKGTYTPVMNLGRVFLKYENEKPKLSIKFDENLPKEVRRQFWDGKSSIPAPR